MRHLKFVHHSSHLITHKRWRIMDAFLISHLLMPRHNCHLSCTSGASCLGSFDVDDRKNDVLEFLMGRELHDCRLHTIAVWEVVLERRLFFECRCDAGSVGTRVKRTKIRLFFPRPCSLFHCANLLM